MQQEEPGRGDPIGPHDWLKILPFEAATSSDRLGWVGLEAARFRAAPASELNPFASTHHTLVLFAGPPQKLDLMYEGVKRHVPPPPEQSRWCRPAARPGCARAGARTSCRFSWSRG